MTGTTLSHYDITAELGRGGMGIVYLAEDTKLDRQVAIKVLPPSALASADDRARFYREAKAAAALNHPNIAQIYQIDEAVPSDAPHGSQPSPFIAMEYIDGEPLEARIKKGPLKLSEAVRLATQIAGALGEAHEKGIVHRDVKASNVMLTSKGDAKVLDFGLALTAASTKLTRMGSTLGTVAYMSPEQARGEDVDRRTDLWALGVVLYEMVAGRNPFGGDYEQAVVYSILNAEPESLTAVRTGVPMQLERIVDKCLAKSPDLRYQTAGGLISDLKAVEFSGSASSTPRLSSPSLGARPADSGQHAGPPATGARRITHYAAAALLMAGTLVGWLLHSMLSGGEIRSDPVIRSEIHVDENRLIGAAALSPNGQWMAYATATVGELWLRNLETGDERVVSDAEDVTEIEFSPDSQWILFDDVDTIYRANVGGGSATVLLDNIETQPHSSWVTPDEIVFDRNENGIYSYSLLSGETRRIVVPDTSAGHIRYLWPAVDPDGSRLITLVVTGDALEFLAVFSYPDGELIHLERWPVVAARFVGGRHVVGVEDQDLVVRAFDPRNGVFIGPPGQLAEDVSTMAWDVTAAGLLMTKYGVGWTASATTGGISEIGSLFTGPWGETVEGLPFSIGRYFDPAVSPDRSRLAIEIGQVSDAPMDDIWVLELDDAVANQLTFGNTGNEPTWTPDGDSLLYVNRQGQEYSSLEILAADGSGRPREIYRTRGRIEYPDLTSDGRLVGFSMDADESGIDVFFLDTVTGEIRLAAGGPGRQSDVQFSPSGAYFSYTDQDRVRVRTTSLDGSEWDLSQGDGALARWSPDARYIYFLSNGALHRVPIDVSEGFRRTGAAESFSGPTILAYSPVPGSDEIIVSRVVFQGSDAAGRNHVDIMTNVFALINRLAPSR